MRPVSASVAIDAPREHVFALLRDLAARPSFTDHFLADYRLARVDPVGVGASARFRLHDSGEWMDTVIETAEPPHSIREQGRGGRANRVPVFTAWELAEGPAPGSCEVTVTFWTEASKPIDRLRPLGGGPRSLRRGWARSLRRLKELAESGRPAERIVVAGGQRYPAVPV